MQRQDRQEGAGLASFFIDHNQVSVAFPAEMVTIRPNMLG